MVMEFVRENSMRQNDHCFTLCAATPDVIYGKTESEMKGCKVGGLYCKGWEDTQEGRYKEQEQLREIPTIYGANLSLLFSSP